MALNLPFWYLSEFSKKNNDKTCHYQVLNLILDNDNYTDSM